MTPGPVSSLSWLRNGFLCYAVDGKHNLEMTYLENAAGWKLAAPQQLVVKPLENSPAPRLLQLQWSTLLTDMAVFDEHGNFYILLAGVGLLKSPAKKPEVKDDGPSYELTSYNHTEMIYRDLQGTQNGTSAHSSTQDTHGTPNGRCVALKWLGVAKPQMANKPAAHDGAQYVYGATQHAPSHAAHPIATKQACVALRQGGCLDLYYQGEHKVEYHKLSANMLPDGTPGSVYFTHASIGFASNRSIVVVAHDSVEKRILTYTVDIDWGFLTELAARQKTDPHFHTPAEQQQPPRMSVAVVHEMQLVPAAVLHSDTRILHSDIASIDILPPAAAQGPDLDILVTYKGLLLYTVHRYRLQAPGSGKLSALTAVVLQDKLTLPGVLHSVHTAAADAVVLFVNQNGAVRAVNRGTWALVLAPVKLDPATAPAGLLFPQITSLLDAGFEFPALELAGHSAVAISPTMASVAYTRGLELVFAPLQATRTGLVAHAAFAFTHAQACYANACSDDLIALMAASKADLREVVTELHSAINFHLASFGKESVDKLLSNPPLQKLLLLQLVASEVVQDRAMGDLAWVVLNLRATSFGIMFLLLSIYRQISKKKPIEDSLADSTARAECILLLVGNVKWLIDLVVYLNQELVHLWMHKDDEPASPTDPHTLTVHTSLVLPVILSKVPRLFLMYALLSIGKTHEILKKLHRDLLDSNKLFTPMKEALVRFFNTCNSAPIKPAAFEAFLRECDTFLSRDFSKAADHVAAQQSIFCTGSLSQLAVPMARAVLERHLVLMLRDLQLLELYFYDSLWLDIGVSRKRKAGTRLQITPNKAVDALRKIFITCTHTVVPGGLPVGRPCNSKSRVRKCVRCRSVSLMRDPFVYDSAALGLWTMVFQRTCICGSAWINCQ